MTVATMRTDGRLRLAVIYASHKYIFHNFLAALENYHYFCIAITIWDKSNNNINKKK